MNTILLIESNSSILENFTEYFEMEGFKILAAKNGNKGIEIAKAFIPDLIISEILMHEITGYDVLRLLQKNPATSEIPFIFCTTKCEENDRATALKLGADDYVVKPNYMDFLCKTARMWIESGIRRNS